MGNKQSNIPTRPEQGYIPTRKTCTVPDTTVLDRRIYQIELIDRAIDIISRTVAEPNNRTSDFVTAQIDAMNYKDPQGIDDPEYEVRVGKKLVKYRHHAWSILLDDPVLVGHNRRNPFEQFKVPLDGNLPVGVVRPLFINYLETFNQGRLAALAALRKECVRK